MVLAFMRFALFPERFGVSIEGTEGAHKFRLGDARAVQPALIEVVLGVSFGPKHRSSRDRRRGKGAAPAKVTGPRHGVPFAT